MRQPIAYIRRSSRSRSDPGDVSREFQTETVRRLAGDDGPTLTILDGDWGKSAATDATDQRLDFLGLLAAVERGEVSAVYAYSTDRLARSVRWAAQFLDACERAGTTIVTSEGRFEPGDDLAHTMFQFQAISNEDYSRKAKAKRRSTLERHRASGRKLGAPYYGALAGESLPAVVAAYERTGSLSATARELNAAGLPSRRGHWAHSTVQRILAREGLVPEIGTRGISHRAAHTFSRLLRCHCGHLLTGSTRSGGAVTYRCLRAETNVDHGRKSVTERAIMAWAVEEMARLRTPADLVSLSEAADAERHALELRIERARELFLAGDIDRTQYDAEKRAAAQALTQLDLQGRAVDIPPFEWDHEPRDLNLALRALWDHVDLGPDLRPVRAHWLLPDSWLTPEAPGSPAVLVR